LAHAALSVSDTTATGQPSCIPLRRSHQPCVGGPRRQPGRGAWRSGPSVRCCVIECARLLAGTGTGLIARSIGRRGAADGPCPTMGEIRAGCGRRAGCLATGSASPATTTRSPTFGPLRHLRWRAAWRAYGYRRPV